MILSAAGEKLSISQRDVGIDGWAVEARLYAEDPYRGFLPSIGRLKRFIEPAEGPLGKGELRIDSGVREGDEISLFYDPMIAKVIGYGKTREDAIDTLAAAMDRLHVEGLQSNAPFLSAVLDEADFRSGRIHTGYIPEHFPEGFNGTRPRDEQLIYMASAAAYMHEMLTRRAGQTSGRVAEIAQPETREWIVLMDERRVPVEITMTGEGEAQIWSPGLTQERQTLSTAWTPGCSLFEASLNGQDFSLEASTRTEGFALRHRGYAATAVVCTPRAAELHALLPVKEKADTAKLVISPMPGLIVSVDVETGQEVKAGEALLVVEAMKMENVIRAEKDGVIKSINVEAGASVAADELMIEFE